VTEPARPLPPALVEELAQALADLLVADLQSALTSHTVQTDHTAQADHSKLAPGQGPKEAGDGQA
jgi:hypothetical protein